MQSLSFLSVFLLVSGNVSDSIPLRMDWQSPAQSETQQVPPPSTPDNTTTSQSPASTAAQPKPAPAFDFGIEEGTAVLLKLGRELSSAVEAPGNRVDFEVAEDVRVNGVVVIPKGGAAWGTIVDAKPKRRMGRAGKLDVRIDEVRLADGERVPLRASQESKGKGRGGVMTGAIIASGILFFPAAPLFLFMHGKDVVIPKGSPVTAYVDQNASLDRAKFDTANPAQPVATPPQK